LVWNCPGGELASENGKNENGTVCRGGGCGLTLHPFQGSVLSRRVQDIESDEDHFGREPGNPDGHEDPQEGAPVDRQHR